MFSGYPIASEFSTLFSPGLEPGIHDRKDACEDGARHSVRAVVVNQNALVAKTWRAEDCPPYLLRGHHARRRSSATLPIALIFLGICINH